MKYFLISILILVLFNKISYSQCPITTFGDDVYDLNRLNIANGNYYITKGIYKFYINVCGISNICASNVKNGSTSTSCIYDTNASAWDSNGQNYTFNIIPLANNTTKGASYITDNPNSWCIGTSQKRTTQIDLICSNDETKVISVNEYPKCKYNFVISSYLACPLSTPKPTSTVTPTPSPSNTVSTSTTTQSEDDTTITTTITRRGSYNNGSLTNTTTITNSIQTTTSTVTTIYHNNQTREVTTRTSIQGSQLVTKTYDTEDN